ncbi:Facilitated trehalose transporter Tret1 [Eumeta japonica]|uniref:Facilitated trehalose transporter Tret1 n=1 Tax=Eumeta variegata TaxID=151549 RepID=A0A4C1SV43_EUMVA|nr:Facilitated trehalose transporter Tret1 [Eumeta japonica]
MSFAANFLTPVLITRYGKQKTHLISTIPAIFGWMMFALRESMPLFIMARLMHGLAFGLRLPLSPALVAEYTDPEYRGAFLGTFAVSLGLGMFLSHLWESPSWLISKGRFEEGIKSFRWLRGIGLDQEKELNAMIDLQKRRVANEAKEINKLKHVNSKILYWKLIKEAVYSLRVFKKRELLKPTIIVINMLIIFEFCGNHFMPAFGNKILMLVLNKENPNDVNWHLTILDILRMACAVVAIFLLKYLRRRTILFTSGFLTVLSMVAIASYIYIRRSYSAEVSLFGDTLPMCIMMIYVSSFGTGLVPINWVICGEIFPMANRNIGTTISIAFLTIIFMISMKTAPQLYETIGVEGSFLCYASILTICLVVVCILLPETKDRTLHDIETSFTRKGVIEVVDDEVEMRLVNTKEAVVER